MSLSFAGTVRRGGFLLDLTVQVPPGEVLAVLGPNGAGKTTLLRAIAGLEPLATGAVQVAGSTWEDDRTRLSVEQRRTGVVFQDYRLFPHLDVRDNVAFPLRSAGAGRATARRGAEGWLGRLGLAELGARRPAELSGGQAQRVALARALAREPDVLLLDEPMAALDAGARMDVRSFLREHLAEFPGPCLLVTHDPLEAMVLADRLLVLESGRPVQLAAPAEIARRPASAYVARLVGLNLWAGEQVGGVVELDVGGRVSVVEPVAERSRVLVALRPSAITLHTRHPEHASPRNVWPGTVTALEPLADRVRVQVAGAPPALVDITQAAVAELDLDLGVPVWLAAKATEMEVYADTAEDPSAIRS